MLLQLVAPSSTDQFDRFKGTQGLIEAHRHNLAGRVNRAGLSDGPSALVWSQFCGVSRGRGMGTGE